MREFQLSLEQTLSLISSQTLPCIFAGDLNVDLLKYETNKDTTDFVNNLLVRNFLPTILMPTRITTKSATLIDHMFFYEGANKNGVSTIKSGNIFSDFSDRSSQCYAHIGLI